MSTSIDTAVMLPDGKLYVFAGERVARYAVAGGRLESDGDWAVSAAFPGAFPRGVDAALLHPDGSLYLFRGKQHMRYNLAARRPETGYPRAYSADWPGVFPDGVDAAISWSPQIIYFFSNDAYTSFSPREGRTRGGYPKRIRANWPGLTGAPVRAAFALPSERRVLVAERETHVLDVAGLALGPEQAPLGLAELLAGEMVLEAETGEAESGRRRPLGLMNPPKPTLAARCYQRDMSIGGDLAAFKNELVKWIATCVTSRTVNPQTSRPYKREIELVEAAISDVKTIFDYAKSHTPMSIPPRWKVYAEFSWGRLNNGLWFVRAVHFSIRGHIEPRRPEAPDIGIHPKVRDLVFGQEYLNIQNFVTDISDGDKLVENIKNTVYQQARKEKKLEKNPVDLPSTKDVVKTFSSVVKGGDIPGVLMAKMAVGSMLQSFINSQAGDVASVRRKAYAWFIAGLVEEITWWKMERTPMSSFEKKYYELGHQNARRYSPKERYQIQLSLLHYASQNPTSFGGWAIPHPQKWHFPEEYARRWDPRLIGEALFNQLYRTKYSVGSDFEPD
jgi:hypothetical protein